MTLEINIDPTPDDDPEKIDFSSPEDVLIEIVGPHDDNPENLKWDNWTIESCTIINGALGITGAASYEQSYVGFLDYTIEGLVECPGTPGWFVVEGITATYHKGDGWTTDDDMDFYCNGIRPATLEEKEIYN